MDTSPWIAHNFGGTSLADAERYHRVAAIPGEEQGAARQAVIVPAMSGATDTLLRTVELASRRDRQYEELLGSIGQLHREAVAGLLGDAPAARGVLGALERDRGDVADVMRVCWLLRSHARSAPELVEGFGEGWSARLLAAPPAYQEARL